MGEAKSRSGRLSETECIEVAEWIMNRFAERTGLVSGQPLRRYLWTDAFAVGNFLELSRLTGKPGHLARALQLVDAVHLILGRHRDDDPRSGWLSGLPEEEGARHPTMGGLRIGKPLPERGPLEPFDEQFEWDRDGQYFHYLTKWMHALDQVAHYTREPHFNTWARELAKASHDAFVQAPSTANAVPHMVSKMSIDLSRLLVASEGEHDALDGFVTGLELRATAKALSGGPPEPALADETRHFAAMIDLRRLASVDPLGIGGLLSDSSRVAQLAERADDVLQDLLEALLVAAIRGIQHYERAGEMQRSPEHRLAFRELGLSIGLRAIASVADNVVPSPKLRPWFQALQDHAPLGEGIVSFWLEPEHQASRSWTDHLDINQVMLATSLLTQ